jgi:uncharacterized protein involved in propanediol utilization
MQRNLRGYAKEELMDEAVRTLNEAQTRAPVRTGQLISSIELAAYMVGGTQLDLELYSDLPYAKYMEKGFTTTSGDFIESSAKTGWRAHFIRDSMLAHEKAFIEAMDRAVFKAVTAKGGALDEVEFTPRDVSSGGENL